jgi:hypothetical protein
MSPRSNAAYGNSSLGGMRLCLLSVLILCHSIRFGLDLDARAQTDDKVLSSNTPAFSWLELSAGRRGWDLAWASLMMIKDAPWSLRFPFSFPPSVSYQTHGDPGGFFSQTIVSLLCSGFVHLFQSCCSCHQISSRCS